MKSLTDFRKMVETGVDPRLHPAVSRSCDCHVFGLVFLSWQITENSRERLERLDILKFSFHQSFMKSPCKRLSNQNWFRGHAHARLARLVFFTAIWRKSSVFASTSWGVVTSTSYEILTFLFAALELRKKNQWPRKPPLYFLKRAWF